MINTIRITTNESGSYEICDDNGTICDCLKKDEVGDALHRWLCIPADSEAEQFAADLAIQFTEES